MRHGRALTALLLGTAAVYACGWNNGFVYEDDTMGQALGLLRLREALPTFHAEPGRWLAIATWTAHPRLAHAESLVLHLAVVSLVYLLAVRLRADRPWLVAGLMALLPIQTEAVAYAVERTELFAALGTVLACCAATVEGDRIDGRSDLAFTGVLFGGMFAMFGKESGVVALPLAMLTAGRWKSWMLPSMLILGLLAWGRHDTALGLITGSDTHYKALQWWQWPVLQSVAVWTLVTQAVMPTSLTPTHFYYVPTADAVTAFALLLALPVLAWRLRVTRPVVTFGILWVVFAVLPRLYLRTVLGPLSEHQMYTPNVGLSFVYATGLGWLVSRIADLFSTEPLHA